MLAKILACVGHNSSNITGLCLKKYWLASATSLTCVNKNTGLHQLQHLSALAISLADISHTTTPANIPRFLGSRESDWLSTVCRFWEWKQSAHCSAPMCPNDIHVGCTELLLLIQLGVESYSISILSSSSTNNKSIGTGLSR